MTPGLFRGALIGCRRSAAIAVTAISLLGFCWCGISMAQNPASPARAAAALKPASSAEQGIRWRDLRPAQQAALKPLEREWAGIDAPRKQKWVEMSARFQSLSPAEQARVQERMAEWARLTPLERGQARLNFQEAKQLPPEDRQARWNAYQSLTPEQREEAERLRKTAARYGTDPTAIVGRFQLASQYLDLSQGANASLSTLRVDLPFRGDFLLRTDLPFLRTSDANNPAIGSHRGVSDLSVTAGWRAYNTPEYALLVGAVSTFPTAAQASGSVGPPWSF